jgi:CRP-like cAMP-binding protein
VPGDWVGKRSLFLKAPRSASVVAVRNSELRTVTSANFPHVIKDHPDEALRLLKELSERLSPGNDKLVL